MKTLICLDCDGTLYTTVSLIPPVKVAQKPVPLSRLEALEAAGVQFVLVSPSSACDGLPYPRITNPDRSKALLEAAERYPSDFYIYRVLKVNFDVYQREILNESELTGPNLPYSEFPNPFDVAAIANSMGVHGERIVDPKEIQPAVERALACGKPALLDVIIDGSM